LQKGYWNGKNYAGVIYMNPLNEETMEIDWRHSIKLPFDPTKMAKLVKTTERYNAARRQMNRPKSVEGWMNFVNRNNL